MQRAEGQLNAKYRRLLRRAEDRRKLLAAAPSEDAVSSAVVVNGVIFDAKEQCEESKQLDNGPALPSKDNNGTATTSEQVAVAIDGETSSAASVETLLPIKTDQRPEIVAAQPEIRATIAAVIEELVTSVHAAAGVASDGTKVKQDVPAAKEADAIDKMAKTDVTNNTVLSEEVVAGAATKTLQPAATLVCRSDDAVPVAGESAGDKADASVADVTKDITVSGGEGVTGAGGLVAEGAESSLAMPEQGLVVLEGSAKEEPRVDREAVAERKAGEGLLGAFWRTPEYNGMVVEAISEQVVQAADVASPTTIGGVLTSVFTTMAPGWVIERFGLGTAAETAANDTAAEPASAPRRKRNKRRPKKRKNKDKGAAQAESSQGEMGVESEGEDSVENFVEVVAPQAVGGGNMVPLSDTIERGVVVEAVVVEAAQASMKAGGVGGAVGKEGMGALDGAAKAGAGAMTSISGMLTTGTDEGMVGSVVGVGEVGQMAKVMGAEEVGGKGVRDSDWKLSAEEWEAHAQEALKGGEGEADGKDGCSSGVLGVVRKLSGGAMAWAVNMCSAFKGATAGLGRVSWTVVKSALFLAADCIDLLIVGAVGCRKAVGGVATGLMRCVTGGVWGC